MGQFGKYSSVQHASENQYREEMMELITDHLFELDGDGERMATSLLINGCHGLKHLTTAELEEKLEGYDLVDMI